MWTLIFESYFLKSNMLMQKKKKTPQKKGVLQNVAAFLQTFKILYVTSDS